MAKNLIGSCLCIVILLACSELNAQKPLRRYQPPGGPTMSPYLDYNRPDWSTSPSPYHSFIVPQRQMQRSLYDLDRQQQASFRKLESAVDEIRATSAAPTGVGGSFQNYSHYYKSPAARRR